MDVPDGDVAIAVVFAAWVLVYMIGSFIAAGRWARDWSAPCDEREAGR